MSKSKQRNHRVKPSGNWVPKTCGYAMFYETAKYYARLDARATKLDKTMTGTLREFIWDFVENPDFDRDEFLNLGCEPQKPKPLNKNHLDNVRSEGIGFISDAKPVVSKVEQLASDFGISKASLVRYILRKNLQ
ncbi:hypothetical protein [Stenotrophomonas bentonitica]|nr:hypothetical protein [Stenotrophomonas bentonitica]